MLQDVYAWVRRHPRAADSVFAMALLAGSAGQLRISPLSAALAATAFNVVLAATVAVRRQAPVAAFAAAALLGAAQLLFGVQPAGGGPPVAALQPTVTDLEIVVLAVHPGRLPASADLPSGPGGLPARLGHRRGPLDPRHRRFRRASAAGGCWARRNGTHGLGTVTDDGAGGASLVPGAGLAGLLERVQTVDGRLEVGSPPGGPTIVTIEPPRHA